VLHSYPGLLLISVTKFGEISSRWQLLQYKSHMNEITTFTYIFVNISIIRYFLLSRTSLLGKNCATCFEKSVHAAVDSNLRRNKKFKFESLLGASQQPPKD
jgi:hypothetical protein